MAKVLFDDVTKRFDRTPFTSVDLSALAPAAQEVAFNRLDRTLHGKLDFERGPLLQFALVRFGADRPDRLIAIVHHQLMDNSSWDVLMEDIQDAYAALEAGRRPRLTPTTSSYESGWGCRSRWVSRQSAGWLPIV